MANQLFFACLMLATGLGIPVMAALSAGVGTRYGSPAFAASILFSVAFMVSAAFLFLVEGGVKAFPKTHLPIYFYFAGTLVAFYVLSVTWVAPRFGVGNAVACVLLGQIISMAAIDQFGLLGAPAQAITFQRSVGLLMMTVGVFLAVRRA